MLCHAYSLAQFIMKTILVPTIENPNVKVRFSNIVVNRTHMTFSMTVEYKQRGRGKQWSEPNDITGKISEILSDYYAPFVKERVLVHKMNSEETEWVYTGKNIRSIDQLYKNNNMETPTVFEAWNDSKNILECPLKLMAKYDQEGNFEEYILSTVHHRQTKQFIDNGDGTKSVKYVQHYYFNENNERRRSYTNPEYYSRLAVKSYEKRILANQQTDDTSIPEAHVAETK